MSSLATTAEKREVHASRLLLRISEKTALRGFDQFMAKGFEKLFSSIIVVDKVSLSD